MRYLLLTTALAFALTGTSFSPASAGDAEFWGTGIGAAMGGLVGSTIGQGSGRLAATGAGVFLGGVVGNSIGSSMDRSSYSGYSGGYYSSYPTYYQSTVYEPTYVAPYAPPPPTVVYLRPQQVEIRQAPPALVTGGYVGVTEAPEENVQDDTRYCREYTQKVKIGGKIQETYGTACLQPDGTWKITR